MKFDLFLLNKSVSSVSTYTHKFIFQNEVTYMNLNLVMSRFKTNPSHTCIFHCIHLETLLTNEPMLLSYNSILYWFKANVNRNCANLNGNLERFATDFNYLGMQFYNQKLKPQARACFLIAWWLGNSIAYGNYLAML